MNINHLRYFVTVLETGSLRDAAKRLHVSSPALSKAIRQLEDIAGAQLLEPSGRGVRPTSAAREVADNATFVLEVVDAFERHLTQHRDALPVRIACNPSLATYVCGAVARDLATVPLHVLTASDGDACRAVARGLAHAGLTLEPAPTGELEHRHIGSLRLAVYGRRSLLAASVPELPFAVPSSFDPRTANLRDADGWPGEGQTRTVRYRVPTVDAALELCRSGLAVAYLPSVVVALHNRQAERGCALHEIAASTTAREADVYLVRAASEPTISTQRLERAAVAAITSV